MANFELEYELIEKGYSVILGLDECARGNLAGPVVAAAVFIDETLVNAFEQFVDDSKKMSPKNRLEVYEVLQATCSCKLGIATNNEIDKLNILEATKLAMGRAVSQFKVTDYLLIDGNMRFGNTFGNVPYSSIVKGDAKSISIAAASIFAKTYHTKLMEDYDKEYPLYGFAKHKGYGTKQHRDAIIKYGVTPIHRKTFKRVREYA
jgi:ribonuclease HII